MRGIQMASDRPPAIKTLGALAVALFRLRATEASYVAANAPVDGEETVFWFCWLLSDLGGRYSRFIHVRHLRTGVELNTAS
jgi:hypothetical protein